MKKQTLAGIAREVLAANPNAGHLEIRTAQLAFLRATKKPGNLNIAAWERMVAYYSEATS